MNTKKICRLFALWCAAVWVLLLTGCNPTAGAAAYEVIYPSGYTRNYDVRDKKIPVEGTTYCLQWEKAEDYEKTYAYDLQILDETDAVLYEYPGIGRDTMRGILQKDDRIWVCTELWTAPHYIGYIEGWLKESSLFLIDLSDGAILFQDKAGENEFYLTSKDTRCYFYEAGEEEGEQLFGFLKTPPKPAEIYYRDTADWKQKHTVYTFDYGMEPEIDTSNGVETRVKFYISEEQIQTVWTSYESVGNGKWEYIEKKVYDIPLSFQKNIANADAIPSESG